MNTSDCNLDWRKCGHCIVRARYRTGKAEPVCDKVPRLVRLMDGGLCPSALHEYIYGTKTNGGVR